MNEKLWQAVRILSRERPTDEGRPVSPDIYVEATDVLIKNSERLISSQPIMEKTGRPNTLFCGHYIYPLPDTSVEERE